MEQMGIIRWLKAALSPQPQKRQGRHEKPHETVPNASSRSRGARAKDSPQEKDGPQPTHSHATKRRYGRYPVEGKELKARAALTEIIELSNVSIGGACIVTTRTLMPGDNVLLKIPSERVGKPLKCTIIWEAVSDRPLERNGVPVPAYKAGVKFNEVPPDTIVRLKDFMRSAGMPEEGDRDGKHGPSPLRFSVRVNEKAWMNFPATFRVKKISLGGMLTDAASELEIGGRYPAALYLPGADRPLRFSGRIASKIPHADGFDAGIEFCDLSDDDRSRLAAFLDTLTAAHRNPCRDVLRPRRRP